MNQQIIFDRHEIMALTDKAGQRIKQLINMWGVGR
jgi:hypothetical protein